jgi:hypothetical protein
MGAEDLAGKVDFVLAFAVVHDLPNSDTISAVLIRNVKARTQKPKTRDG